MIRVLALICMVVAVAGCVTKSHKNQLDMIETEKDDFRYLELSGATGVRAYSRMTGTSFEIFCRHPEGLAEFVIQNSGTPAYSEKGGEWTTYLSGQPFLAGEQSYTSSAAFLKSLDSLEVRQDSDESGAKRTIKVSGGGMRGLPRRCEPMLNAGLIKAQRARYDAAHQERSDRLRTQAMSGNPASVALYSREEATSDAGRVWFAGCFDFKQGMNAGDFRKWFAPWNAEKRYPRIKKTTIINLYTDGWEVARGLNGVIKCEEIAPHRSAAFVSGIDIRQ